MPRNDRTIAFHPVTEADLPLLARWMDEPHWREWWGDPEVELGYIRDMIEGRDSTRPFLFHVDGKPCGYIQCWSIGDHQTSEWTEKEPWLMDVPSEAVGVDLAIGDASSLSHGIGSSVLKAFLQKLLNEGYEIITIDPDPANVRAVAAYRKAGFAPIPSLEGRYDDVLIMQYGPDPVETPGKEVLHAE